MAQSNKKRDAERRSAAAAKAAELREKQRKAERRRQSLLVGGIVVGVLVLIGVVAGVYFVSQKDDKDALAAEQPATSVQGFNSDYGIVAAKGKPKAELVIYEDFQCPACQQFQSATAPVLERLVNKGVVSVEYRMIALLDSQSSTRYSTRALNAAQCVADEAGTQAYLKMHDLLYANQPAEGSAGLPDATLARLAKQAGAPGATSCINDLTYEGWTLGATQAATDAGVTSTPTLMLNGKEMSLEGLTVGTFEKQLYEAAGQPVPASVQQQIKKEQGSLPKQNNG